MSKANKLKFHPLALQLKDIPIVVVGGGKVAQRKILQFINAQASIRCISPQATILIKKLARRGSISWNKKCFQPEDLQGASIVIAATDDSGLNKNVSSLARKHRLWVNVVDNAALSSFICPAVIHQRKTALAIYTDGRDPRLSRDLKNYIKEQWHDFLCYRDRLQKKLA